MTYNYIKRSLPLLFLFVVLLAATATAEDVTFKAVLTNPGATIHVGDTFTINVLLDVVTGKAIKSAEFRLGSGKATFSTAATANLFNSPTFLYGLSGSLGGGGYTIRYGETTVAASAEREGNNLHFATLTATAITAGSATLTFSDLVAARGTFGRTETSIPLTFTIVAADTTPSACTAGDWTTGEWSRCISSCLILGNPECEGAFQVCGVAPRATHTRIVTSNRACTGGIPAPSTTETCTLPACTIVPPTGGSTQQQQLIDAVTAIPPADVPTTWTAAFISRMAGILRTIFG